MASNSGKLEQLRQAVLGNGRGRQAEVEPTGEIRISEETDENGQDLSEDRPKKASKMSPHTFGS
ncbi:MAG: hypothetical protein JRJ03_00140 [Deltaproteobacteria bacterium]|nr:hypothetical protein [Deltaproteobacteria bacterium]